MGLLTQREPRAFSHRYIYVDERAERIRGIEERARRELGMLPPEDRTHDGLRGAFRGCHGRRATAAGFGLAGISAGAAVLAILFLLALAYCLAA